MFGFFRKKREKSEINELKKAVQTGFNSAKQDIGNMGVWIKHLDSAKEGQQKDINEIKSILSSIQEDIEGVKNVVSVMNDLKPKQVFKTPSRVFDKQTAVQAVQTPVQTAVQTPNFDQFSITERAILWILLNSDIKLSYDDLAAILMKEKSTIRGQINTIKQKSDIIVDQESKCFVCGEYFDNDNLPQIAHRISKSKQNYKKYGYEVITTV